MARGIDPMSLLGGCGRRRGFSNFSTGPPLTKPIVGPLCRVLVLRLAVHAKMRERSSHGRT